MKLYDYQKTCIEYALKAGYSMNACEPGLGKTRIALEFIRRTGKDGFIVGPAFLKNAWLAEAKKVGVENILFCSYSMIHKMDSKELMKYGTWVADEFTYIKSPTAMRTNAYYTLLKKCAPTHVLLLSGTPIKNRVSDLWVPLAICSQPQAGLNGLKLEGKLQKYRAFCRHFCNVEMLRIRGRQVEKFSGVNPKNLQQLKDLLKHKYIRYKVEDVLKDLPSMTTIEVPLKLRSTPGLEEAFRSYMEGSKVDPTAKATSALLKAQATAEYATDLIDAGEPILIFSDHIAPVKEIVKALKDYSVAEITGATSAQARSEYVEYFQSGKLHAIVATIGALSTGVTLTRGRHVIFSDLSWSPSENTQCAARIRRIGQKDACFRHIMISSDTDAYISKTLLQKEKTILQVLA